MGLYSIACIGIQTEIEWDSMGLHRKKLGKMDIYHAKRGTYRTYGNILIDLGKM